MAPCCRKCGRTEFCISLHDWPQQVIFMDCLQVAPIWHSKEVCNFYTLSSSLFILWKPHLKGQPCSASLPNFRQKEKFWMQSQDRYAKQIHQMSCSQHSPWQCCSSGPDYRGNPNENEVPLLSCLNDATFMFFCMEMSACFGRGSAPMEERMGQRPCGKQCHQHMRSDHGHALLWHAQDLVGALLKSSNDPIQSGASELPPEVEETWTWD